MNPPRPWLTIVGIGEDGLDGLSATAKRLVDNAEVLVGGARHLALVDTHKAERLVWRSPLVATFDDIAARRGRRVVVLASGDPMWFGVGATLAGRFPQEETLVLPQAGAFSLAASRLGWPLADIATLTLHGRPLDRLALHLAPGARLLTLTEDRNAPPAIAHYLTTRGWGPSRLTLLERLGGPEERRLEGIAAEWVHPPGADLNTLAIECVPGPRARPLSRIAGLPDDAFVHDGQLTKREVRAATLSALAPLPGQTLWDVGAGSGSISIEWLRTAPGTRAFAIERDESRRDFILRNAAALGVPELHLIAGAAPAALRDLPAPDAVFIGGGLSAEGLVETCLQALKPGGRLVANAVTVEGEASLLALHAKHGGQLTRIAVSRAEPVGKFQGWRSLMPVTQWILS
jgi:precorrin-6B C5,15-methyltransferase / cobalt-precorrin-6B C5,C15-methyltransferase